ncbi:MAG: aryl-sulfate sulfotransferase, partial [Candidatus Poribacteria bacterium]
MSIIYHLPHFEDASSPGRMPDSFSTLDFDKEVVELDWNGDIVWRYSAPGEWVIHHDMARLQNGNTLILMEKQANVPVISDKPIAENFFIEVNPDGEVVWDWHTAEHFDEFGYSEAVRRLMRRRGKDIFHSYGQGSSRRKARRGIA